MKKIFPVVMAGGSGTRLWPLSRKMFPKQFLPLTGELSMFQETLKRLYQHQSKDVSIEPPIIVCNEEHRFLVAEQLRKSGFGSSAIILEPAGKNTAPAVALAAQEVESLCKTADQPLLLVLAADHVIRDSKSFHSAIGKAAEAATHNKLATFGIVPRSPETGYGYIKSSKITDGLGEVEQFVEKPDSATAQGYLDSGNYYWNSGMFLFKANVYLQELTKHRPDIAQAVKTSYLNTTKDLDFTRVDKEAFLACPAESIDYAVMEKTDAAVVTPLDAGWSDVGSWSSLWEESEQDSNGNVLHGDVLAHEARNNLLFSENKLIAAIGVQDLVVVDTPDAVMVCTKDRVQDVKEIVKQLELADRSEATFHREVARPWGSYDSIDMGDRFQVKRITVKPGAKLSLQMHHHRAEHWIIVSGTALVTIGDKEMLLSENESTYIPIGETHRLENPGVMPLEMIEVQSGSYLGEDDIVRFEDTYGRS